MRTTAFSKRAGALRGFPCLHEVHLRGAVSTPVDRRGGTDDAIGRHRLVSGAEAGGRVAAV